MRLVADGKMVEFGGSDGVSPTIEVSEISGGHRVEITDASGTKSFDVMNGADGATGATGPGIPPYGSTGQILSKKSSLNYDTKWIDAPQGGDSGIPSGIIVMWSGSPDEIPDGWVVCNGDYDTPDLRDKFILGWGNLNNVGDSAKIKRSPVEPYWFSPKMTSSTEPSPYVVTASSYYVNASLGHTYPYYAFDGKDTTRWTINQNNAGTDTEWIKIDFGSNLIMSGIRMKPLSGYLNQFVHKFDLYAHLDDGGTEKIYATSSLGELIDDWYTYEFEPKTCDSCKLVSTGGSSNNMGMTSIAEIEFLVTPVDGELSYYTLAYIMKRYDY